MPLSSGLASPLEHVELDTRLGERLCVASRPQTDVEIMLKKKKKKDHDLKKSEEERQNPGFLSLITPRDANGITKSSTSPGCVLAKNRCTHYYSRKPIRAAAGQRSSNTVSTRAARISTHWRLSDPRSQLWKFVMTSDDNSTVCAVLFCLFFFCLHRSKNLFDTINSIQMRNPWIYLQYRSTTPDRCSFSMPFGCVFIFHFKLFVNKKNTLSAASDTLAYERLQMRRSADGQYERTSSSPATITAAGPESFYNSKTPTLHKEVIIALGVAFHSSINDISPLFSQGLALKHITFSLKATSWEDVEFFMFPRKKTVHLGWPLTLPLLLALENIPE